MFGKIVKIDEDLLKVENLKKSFQANVMNYHVVFEEKTLNGISRIVGEIIDMDNETISLSIIGEIKDNSFIPGKIHYPNIFSQCRFIYKEELELIIGSQDYMAPENLYLGESALYDGYKITTKINQFLNQHFVLVGNSGYGKSCGVASFIQNLFYYNNKLPKNAHIILFDVYGEYRSALTKVNEMSGVNVKYLNFK